jgi:YgiT-type zinc finger domain-containing protein
MRRTHLSEQCCICGRARLIEKRARYIHQLGEDMLIVEDVPCLECDSCGEQYFAIAALKQIEAGHAALSSRR